jgi:hypothetical protein
MDQYRESAGFCKPQAARRRERLTRPNEEA